MTKAWMLRQDGKAFSLVHHLYVMSDPDLSSEAEVASFIISTKSDDIILAEYILDAWMAMLIENSVDYDDGKYKIRARIEDAISNLPYRFLYPLEVSKYLAIHDKLQNYSDVGQLYDFLDDVRMKLNVLSDDLKYSLNQQFCRVRYGGQYNSYDGNSEIWFRISSVNYNWANTIYLFTSSIRRILNVSNITICRDYESDNGEVDGRPEYFYKAKDGSVYFHMPLNEYLEEEHEHSVVFADAQLNSGVLCTIRCELAKGSTLRDIFASLKLSGIDYDINSRKSVWNYLVRKEQSKCIQSSDYFDALPNRTKNKLNRVKSMILQRYPEIEHIDITSKPHPNRAGNPVGFEMIFEIESRYEVIDHLNVNIVSSKALGDIQAPSIVRLFCREYDDYIKYAHISFKED